MDLTTMVEAVAAEIAALDAKRDQLVAARIALEAAAFGTPAMSGPNEGTARAGRAGRRSRPSSVAVPDDDPTSTALLAALAESGEALPVSVIEADAKTGLALPVVRKKLQALAAAKLVTQTGSGAGTRYQAR